MRPKAIIFDVGGVLIRTQSRAGREKWAARLGLDSWDFENIVFNSESGKQAEAGQKSGEAHWRGLGHHFGLDASALVQMRSDFFAGDVLNEALVAQAVRLRGAGYRIALLSNYADNARQFWAEQYSFVHHFSPVVISAEVGVVKPNPQIYQVVLARLGIKAEDALFIDDFEKNIIGARQVGLQTIRFVEPEEAQRQLAAITGVS